MEHGSNGMTAAAEARTVLVVSPLSDFAAQTRAALLEAGFAVALARDGTEARGRIRRAPAPAAAFLSLLLPGEDSLALLADLRAAAPDLPVIAVAAPGVLTRAALAVEAGACDHLITPADPAWIIAVLRNALAVAADPPPRFGTELISTAPAMLAALERLRRLAPALGPVLLQGERGAGRRAAARALHAASGRAAGPFLRIDCTELDDAALLERLFAPGVPAGPPSDRAPAGTPGTPPEAPPPESSPGGALAAAAGGMLMLDGISAVGPAVQARLLRLLQSPDADPHRPPPPRLVVATARDLRARARDGRFREELHYRLAVGAVTLPPLRDRREDIAPLAQAVLAAETARRGRRFEGFHPEVLRAFAAHPWPGNLHQLHAVVRGAVAAGDGRLVTPDLLPEGFLGGLGAARRDAPPAAPPPPAAAPPTPAEAGAQLALRVAPLVGATLAEVETALIEATLARCSGSTVRAARILGVAPSTLYRRRGRPEDFAPDAAPDPAPHAD